MPTTDKRPLKVFLCHASADKPKVRELYRTLKRRGIQPWLDAENLIAGQNWEVEIPKAIHSSDAIIICLSPNSVDKEGYVQKEIKFALDKALEMPEGRIFLIPAKLEECDLPFSLRQYQAVNLYEKEGYVKLMKALKLRASQLERNTVELPKKGEITQEIKKVVEESESVEPKSEKPPTKSFQQVDELSPQQVDINNPVLDMVRDERPVSVKADKKHVETSESKDQKPGSKKIGSIGKPNTAVIIGLFGLVGTICAALMWILQQALNPAPVPTMTAANTVILSTTYTSEVKFTYSSPTKTSEPSSTFTKVFAPVNTLPSETSKPTLTPTKVFIVAPTGIPSETPNPSPTSTEEWTPTVTFVPTEFTDMRLVPAGVFTMGSDADDSLAECQKFSSTCNRNTFVNEEPPHQVELSAFYIDVYEVTNARYKACVDAGTCTPPDEAKSSTRPNYYGDALYNNYPVIYVSWDQAKSYCEEWRGARLPTEAEWEKASRGTDGRIYPWGNVFDGTKVNFCDINCLEHWADQVFDDEYADTAPVGSYESGQSLYGIYDMAGNVEEWVDDWYQAYPGNTIVKGNETARVVRGSSWLRLISENRSSRRFGILPSSTNDHLGFRCARDTNP